MLIYSEVDGHVLTQQQMYTLLHAMFTNITSLSQSDNKYFVNYVPKYVSATVSDPDIINIQESQWRRQDL